MTPHCKAIKQCVNVQILQPCSPSSPSPAPSLQNHQYHCPRFPVQCPNQCGTPNIAREDLANHVKESCGSALVLCPFKDAGCKHRVRALTATTLTEITLQFTYFSRLNNNNIS